ncbi:ubiquitin-like small modifier protein SAMP2 [Salinarchaeum laminariae]|uniref:ubiquitin-like small modifier protein SAMP2 n=1 Tax=Salinarchaeum laminariae TaxID=869888 RepID=UPI0020BD6973|nr:ubiquitin-like small modifier protein 2 [Salinarchaeum laminariae]
MDVVVTVAGDDAREVRLPDDATYGDLLDAVDCSRHEATALVDGQPVPADAPVDADAVSVLQLVKGG